jgi:hypothetical protein
LQNSRVALHDTRGMQCNCSETMQARVPGISTLNMYPRKLPAAVMYIRGNCALCLSWLRSGQISDRLKTLLSRGCIFEGLVVCWISNLDVEYDLLSSSLSNIFRQVMLPPFYMGRTMSDIQIAQNSHSRNCDATDARSSIKHYRNAKWRYNATNTQEPTKAEKNES